ncbi:MAG: glycosyltransferase family 39 protein [Clostridiales bacterium]|nr:glycosyltransferase family 39 protein [Clostridiales bacterium]
MIFNILFSIVIWGTLLFAVFKFIPVTGINVGQKYLKMPVHKGISVSTETMLKIFFAALLFRMAVYFISVISAVLMLKPDKLTIDFILNSWSRWDALRYISITENGYMGMLEENEPVNCVFFPLYPWLVRLFHIFIRDTRCACLVVSTLAYSGAMPFLYALVAGEYGRRTGVLTCIYLSVAPFSFFLGGMMSESVFLFTTVLSWYCISRKKWMYAGIAGFFAAMSRIAGVLIVIPFIMEIIESNSLLIQTKKYKKFFTKSIRQGIWGLIIPCGILVYLLINYRYTGNPFKFMEYQQKFWHHTSCYFGKGLQTMWNDTLSSGRNWISKMDLFIPQTAAYTIEAIIIAIFCYRHRSVYTIYFIAYFILNTGITWSMSGARYAALNIPFYIIIAEITEKNEKLQIGFILSSAMLFGIYGTMYLAGHQIM